MIKLGASIWTRAENVTAIIVQHPWPNPLRKDTKTLPAVRIHILGQDVLGWEFNTVEEAEAWADRLAKKVNDVLSIT